jgi:hypothetical protein
LPTPSSALTPARAAAVLLLLTIAFYWKLALTDQYIWFDHPDMVYLELPRLQFQAREIDRGRFPLWDPYLWCGQPLAGQTQPGPLFPLNLIFFAMPLEDGYLSTRYLNWYYVAVHFLAALFCFRLCRELRLGAWAGILAGCAFSFGGFLGTVPWLDVMNGAIWTPLVALHLYRSAAGIRPASSAARAGLWLGVAWLSGHHELPLLISAVAALASTAIAWRNRRWIRHGILLFAVAGLVSAVQVWPTYEFARLSKRWVGAESEVEWKDRVPYTIHTIYSLPAKGIAETVLPSASTYGDTSPFLGATVVALAALGLAAGWERAPVRALAALAGLALIWALGALTPLHGVIYSISPMMARARLPVRALHLLGFALAVLSAYGMHSLLARETERWTRRVAMAAASAGLLGLAAAWIMEARGEGLADRTWLAALAACATAAVLWAWMRGRAPSAACAAALIGGMLVELTPHATGWFAHRFEGMQLKYAGLLDRDRDIAGFLRGQPDLRRVAVSDRDIPMNFGDWHAIEALQGYVAAVPLNLTRLGLHLPHVQRMMGVSHFLGSAPDHPGQVEVFRGASGVKVFRNPGAMQKAWSVHEVIQVAGLREIEAHIHNPAFDFQKLAVMERRPPALESCDKADELRLIRHAAGRVTVSAKMACRGLVVLADSFYPGWRARVDGRAADILQVNGALRGVVVEAGEHVIDMRYLPASVLGGGALSLLGLAAVGALTLRSRRDDTADQVRR